MGIFPFDKMRPLGRVQSVDKLPLEVRHLGNAGGAAELLHHLGGEPLTVAPARRHGLVGLGLKGSGVGLIGCHADFLLDIQNK